jgi:hypothetical protein
MRTSRWTVAFALMLATLLAGGCAAKQERVVETVVVEREAEKAPMALPALAEAPAATGGTEGDRGYAASDVSLQERMIIRTVSMSVLVEDTDETLSEIRSLVASYDGYVADSNRWLIDDTQAMAQITIRVPAESLDAALEALRGMVLKVERETSSGQDVTEEYTDIQAQLRNLEATETELLALLTEVRENRGKAEEILAVHRELTSIRGQIESLKGRSQYLERMTALATISMEIRPKATPGAVVEQYRWNPLVTASQALRSLLAFGRVVIDVGIYLLVFSPVVIIPIVILWLIVRALRRGRKPSAATD